MRFFFSLILIYWSSAGRADQSLDDCQAKIAPAFYSSHLHSSEVRPGLHGGLIIFVKKQDSKSWKLRISGADKPGDFRCGPAYATDGLKDFFSIHAYNQNGQNGDHNMISEDSTSTISIPNIEEINGGLLKLKQALQAQSLPHEILTFYEANKVVDAATYLLRLAEQQQLPMGTIGELFEHDFNYHFLSSLVTPPQVVSLMSKRAKLLLQFLDYAKSNEAKYNVLKNNHFARNFATISLELAIKGLDLQGNNWMLFHNLYPDTPKADLSVNLTHMFLKAQNPSAYLKNIIRRSSIGPILFNVLKFNEQADELVDQFCKESPAGLCAEDLPLSWVDPESQEFVRISTEHFRNLEKASLHQVKQFKHRIDGR